MESSDGVEDCVAPPETWEVADVEASVRRLMLSPAINKSSSDNNFDRPDTTECSGMVPGLDSDDLIGSVDQFLREAIQNPRERLSVLRMEQDVEKFIRDPTRDQMDFQQLPTSYLRLAAHRVAQHYSLQSMVLLDNNLPDGSGSRIIVRKTSDLQLPLIRLADIPVNLPTEESGVLKVAIKQRPKKGVQINSDSHAHSSTSNNSKSMEERNEEYHKARARIFSSNSYRGSSSGKPEIDPRPQANSQCGSLGIRKADDKLFPVGGSHSNIGRSMSDSSVGSSRLTGSFTGRDPGGRSNKNNKVAIFRDREGDRKDPDYDRRYDRYVQRFDPGFGYSGGPYTVQPMYTPALNYSTEFPQLGLIHNPSISSELQPQSSPQHLSRPWNTPSASAGYGPVDPVLSPFSHTHANTRSYPGLYMHSAQYPGQQSGLPYVHPLGQVYQPFSQQQTNANFGQARPR